ncbi:MAG: PQQ-binding-like beta-propeller repeat protein [Verrucomicrobia bacterium]|nr:PQQ-binding-like beta-propeller repeat protein [Verrucomicrobiota bacterium]
MFHRLIAISLTLAAFAPQTLRAENWPQWRGPFFNGSTTETGLPAQWSKTENVAWIAPLPGKSSATPIVWGDSVFVTTPDTNKNLLLLCLNTADGKVRWQRCVVPGGDFSKGKNNACSPSVVTDGKLAIATFATGDIAAFDFAGRKVWSRALAKEFGKPAFMWIYGSSPLLYRGKLYVQVLQRNPPTYQHSLDDKPERESFLLCLDPQTGKTLWRQLRKTDAIEESQESYATPLPYEGARGTEIILFGGDYVTGHRADNGAELWRCGSFNTEKKKVWRVITSPATAPGFIYLGLPKRNPFHALKAGATGLVSPDAQTAWKLDDLMPDVCTPLTYRGKLFVLDGDKQLLACLDPKTGEKKWQGSIGKKETYSASPTGADGKIYCIGERGTVVVLSAGDEFKILATFTMDEIPVLSSIVAANGRLFIRTASSLYCVGGKK